ncbi:MAG: PAS domain-containing protein [Asticcacaulis sp.]
MTQYRDSLQLAEKLAHVGHWRLNLLDDTAYWSAEIYNILGCDPKTYVPRRGGAMHLYHEDDRAGVAKIVETAIRHKSGFNFRKRMRRADNGEIRIVNASGHLRMRRKRQRHRPVRRLPRHDRHRPGADQART